MGRRQEVMGRLTKNGDLTVDPFPGTPLVEISGDHRVLIEGHRGVLEYSHEKILVSTKMSNLCVCGDGLDMVKMTQDQLIIQGRIYGVTICRRT